MEVVERGLLEQQRAGTLVLSTNEDGQPGMKLVWEREDREVGVGPRGALDTVLQIAVGSNRHGQAGHAARGPEGQEPRAVPARQIGGGVPLRVRSGWRNNLVLTEEGKAWLIGVPLDHTRAAGRGGGDGASALRAAAPAEMPPAICINDSLGGQRVTEAALGWQHALVLTQAGAVWSWGFGGYGALGTGTRDDRVVPDVVDALLGMEIIGIECGSYASAALTSGGALYTWGWGKHGQLGHGSAMNSLWPREVRRDRDGADMWPVRAVSLGHLHIAVLGAAGGMWTCGLGSHGRLGYPSPEERLPRLVESNSNGDPLRGVRMVDCGYAHTAMVDGFGAVWTCGQGSYGALGLGDLRDRTAMSLIEALPPVRRVSCGGFFTAAVDRSGRLWTWGRNDAGQLGRPCYLRSPSVKGVDPPPSSAPIERDAGDGLVDRREVPKPDREVDQGRLSGAAAPPFSDGKLDPDGTEDSRPALADLSVACSRAGAVSADAAGVSCGHAHIGVLLRVRGP
mmetsp:Transcript_14265/g.38950  ORF Transcript_14265/g.38950 Transcript_14265/m.38950 type:complete len:509 (+) Transcript_14265:101-1627(+)